LSGSECDKSDLDDELVEPDEPVRTAAEPASTIASDDQAATTDAEGSSPSPSFFGSMLRGVLHLITPSFLLCKQSPPSPSPAVHIGSKRSLEDAACSDIDAKRPKLMAAQQL
jgi:hypothetical protein